MANKYGNKKCEFNGFKFDSHAERARYIDLLDMEKRELISEIILQPKFVLQAGFERNGIKHKPLIYIADFLYVDDQLRMIIEDVKGMATKDYLIKRKLYLSIFSHTQSRFREVRLKGNKWEITEL